MIRVGNRFGHRLFFILFLLDTLPNSAIAQTDISGGDVSGTWALSDSPYYIHGEITIPDQETLEIMPGVSIIFTGHYKFNVKGRLLAAGTKEAMIYFTAQDTAEGWHGIRFFGIKPGNDTSRIIYCQLSRGMAVGDSNDDRCGGALFIKNADRVLISHCTIINNMSTGDQFTGGAGIFLDNSSPIITNNFLSHNRAIGGHGGGICLFYDKCDPVIMNNTIYNNEALGGGGIACYQCNPVLVNNTISGNVFCDHGGGVDFIDSSPTLVNSIIFGNNAITGTQVHVATFNGPVSEPNFLYCDIEGGKDAFARDHYPGGEFSGRYEKNIDMDPVFMDAGQDNYRLSDSSPCIGKGTLTLNSNNKLITVLPTDPDGNIRPGPADSYPDLGAFESHLQFPAKQLD